jgi:hypothetical protein
MFRLYFLGSWCCTSLALVLAVLAILAVPEEAFADSGACDSCATSCTNQCGSDNDCYEVCMTGCLNVCCSQQCGSDPTCWNSCCQDACGSDQTCLNNCLVAFCSRMDCETPNCLSLPCSNDNTGCNKTPGSCNDCNCKLDQNMNGCECHP